MNLDFRKINTVHKLYDLGLCALVAQFGSLDVFIEKIQEARQRGEITKGQAYNLRRAVRFAVKTPPKRTISTKEYNRL